MYNTFVVENIGGNCPVQAEGVIDGKRFYFRARGSQWSFSVADKQGDTFLGKGCFNYAEEYKPFGPADVYAAGWMTLDEAHAFLLKAASLYYKTKDITNGGV